MLRLDRVIKSWKESGALNSQINLYGFWNEHTFITKSGDLGIVLQLQGVDYESLDQAAQEYAVKRLEAALKIFGPGFHVYQHLYADISFLFTIQPGETWNDHLDREYLAVLETDNATPYYLNLHNREVAHTLILGATGSGNAFLRKHVRNPGTGRQMELPLFA